MKYVVEKDNGFRPACPVFRGMCRPGFLAAILLLGIAAGVSIADQTDNRSGGEYEVKAAFIFNFLKFADWPAKKVADSNGTVTIGIVGGIHCESAFRSIEGKEINGKRVVVKRFKGLEELKKTSGNEKANSLWHDQLDAITKCHILFICYCESKNTGEIINLVKGHNVLTVGDSEGFLETGGIIGFLVEDKKVRFEISVTAAKQAGIEIRSQLLRLAKRVLKPETTDDGRQQDSEHPQKGES